MKKRYARCAIIMNVERIAVYTAQDVAYMLGVSRATAYRIIDQLNRELEKKNCLVISGKVSKKYFDEKIYA